MKKFGLACEGITDQITLENILCGYYEDPFLDEEITQLQPHLDISTQNQKNFGGWEMLIDYLQSSRFRDDVINVEYVVLQLDTDIIEHRSFGGCYRDNNGLELPTEELINNTITELISKINLSDDAFYTNNKEKIVFSICVHSLECWLYAFYNKKLLKNPKTTGCGKALNILSEKGFYGTKDTQLYKKYSAIFLNRDNINLVAQKAPSFKFFIHRLNKIT